MKRRGNSPALPGFQTISKNFKMKAIYSLSLLAGTVLIAATGCIGYVREPRDQRVYVSPPAVIYEEDDYVYYPRYQMYYGSRSHRYYAREGSAWVVRPVPPRVSVDILIASPKVHVDFHDAPAVHHSQVVQTYPESWVPPGQSDEGHGRKKGQKKDAKEDRKENRQENRNN